MTNAIPRRPRPSASLRNCGDTSQDIARGSETLLIQPQRRRHTVKHLLKREPHVQFNLVGAGTSRIRVERPSKPTRVPQLRLDFDSEIVYEAQSRSHNRSAQALGGGPGGCIAIGCRAVSVVGDSACLNICCVAEDAAGIEVYVGQNALVAQA